MYHLQDVEPTFKTHSTQKLNKALEVASYFGFAPVQAPPLKINDRRIAKRVSHHISNECLVRDFFSEQKTAVLRHYTSDRPHENKPYLISYRRSPRHKGLSGIHLDVLGTEKSTSEALVIRTLMAILEEEGYKKTTLEINSLGDDDSMDNFEKEIDTFLRKNINQLGPEAQAEIKQDRLALYNSHNEHLVELRNTAPSSLSFLTEKSRKHFMEVLEFLEHFDIDYNINDKLMSKRHVTDGIVFEISEQTKTNKNTLGFGTRYNNLAKQFGFRNSIPATGATLCYKKKRKTNTPQKTSLKNLAQPKFYFIQLGFDAKLQSLRIIDELRRKNIPVCHSLTQDTCSDQISRAERLKLPYMLILGQKEAQEKAIMVREVQTREQHTIPINQLVGYLRKIK